MIQSGFRIGTDEGGGRLGFVCCNLVIVGRMEDDSESVSVKPS